ncbi:MAG: Fic family protein [Bacteroidetes bacterium]|nr:Fic family protein [Bacteroidota bacterium]MBK9423905.1 Fic family protein [Bacteroidota bacterium]
MYIYQDIDWPNFYWDNDALFELLSVVSRQQGRLLGTMESLGWSLQSEAMLQSMTTEIIKSNEIEGEVLDHDQVRSSIARRLGLEIAGLIPADRNVDGVVEVMLDATQKFKGQLTKQRLFGWHAALFPSGRSGMHKIVVGKWRDNTSEDPMQVVSGAMGKEKVHFQAPQSEVLTREMTKYLKWFNAKEQMNPLIKAAIAHLWFVTIHPFDDGNGRLARTIADMQLARADGIPKRFYSMSAQIRIERKEYYNILEKTQQGSLNITQWLIWFLECLNRSLIASEKIVATVVSKARFWDDIKTVALNERQIKMINMLFDNFTGKLTSSKWAKICKCSPDTALRDINDLIEKGVLQKEQNGGRSTNYKLQRVEI